MKSIRCATLVALVILACAGRGIASPAGPPQITARGAGMPQGGRRSTTPAAAHQRIVFLGDSLTAGYGLAREESVPSLIGARLARKGLPYDVVNYLCGFLRIAPGPYLAATALGSLPAMVAFVLAGAAVDRVDAGTAGLDPAVLLAALVIFALSLVIARVLHRRTGT